MNGAPLIGRSRADAPGRVRGRFGLAALALLVGLAAFGGSPGERSLDPRAAVADAVRDGTPYYVAAVDALRAAGPDAPSLLAVPPPASATVGAALPAMLRAMLLGALAVAVATAWAARLAPVLRNVRARAVAGLLLVIGASSYWARGLADVPEAWSGLLVALSLARRGPGRTTEPAALGLAAAALSAAAVPYLLLIAVLAARDGERREAAAWLTAAGAAALAMSLHLAVLERFAPAAPFAVAPVPPGLGAIARGTLIEGWSAALAAPLLAAALWGWGERGGLDGGRIAATLGLYALLAAVFGGDYIGLMVAALLPTGLLFVPDALAGAWAAATARPRRITVTRVAP